MTTNTDGVSAMSAELGHDPERALWDAMGCIADDEACLTMLRAHIAATVAAERKSIAIRVVAAFDGVDWTKHTFNFNGALASTSTGEKVFYQAGEVDKGISRLNALVTELKA